MALQELPENEEFQLAEVGLNAVLCVELFDPLFGQVIRRFVLISRNPSEVQVQVDFVQLFGQFHQLQASWKLRCEEAVKEARVGEIVRETTMAIRQSPCAIFPSGQGHGGG